jgi:hypothetical protein
MLDYALGGRPGDLRPFHRTSLVLHVLNAALIVLILYRLFGADRSELGYTIVPSSMRTFLAEQRGSRNYEDQSILDLRIEKVLKIGDNDRISVYADIANVFNSGTINDRLP